MTKVDLIELAAQRRAMLDAIVLDHPAKAEAHEAFQYVIQHARRRDGKGKLCVPLIGPSQSGKSTIIESFAQELNTAEALSNRRIPVLHVTLEANVTRKGLAQNTLEAISEYGFEVAQTGSESLLHQRVRHFLRLAEVELLVFDEVHHLVNSESKQLAYSVGETIKRMLIKGVCPIVLSGVSENGEGARRPLENKQLQQRAVPTVELRKFSRGNPADIMAFSRFLAGYLQEMERQGIASNATQLTQGDCPACILEVSDGVLGATCNLLKEVVRVMTYDGRNDIEHSDLIKATDQMFVRTGLANTNPFLSGPSVIRKVA